MFCGSRLPRPQLVTARALFRPHGTSAHHWLKHQEQERTLPASDRRVVGPLPDRRPQSPRAPKPAATDMALGRLGTLQHRHACRPGAVRASECAPGDVDKAGRQLADPAEVTASLALPGHQAARLSIVGRRSPGLHHVAAMNCSTAKCSTALSGMQTCRPPFTKVMRRSSMRRRGKRATATQPGGPCGTRACPSGSDPIRGEPGRDRPPCRARASRCFSGTSAALQRCYAKVLDGAKAMMNALINKGFAEQKRCLYGFRQAVAGVGGW